MKNLYQYFSLLLFSSLLFSCDKIDDPVIELEGCVDQCTALPTENYISKKAVLIEEFTGITCNNCPDAALKAQELKDKYPGSVVLVGIHASSFATPNPSDGYDADFRTNMGTEYYDFVNPLGLPIGTIDRLDQDDPQRFPKPFTSWESAVTKQLAKGDTADIGILANPSIIDTDGDTSICLEVKFKSLADLTNDSIYWTGYLLESDIKAQQKMPDGSKNKDYKHKHVLRAGFTGTFGTPIPNFDGSLNSVACSSSLIAKDPNWKARNLEVVVMVYNIKTFEVIQAIEIKL
tara:strand:- start:1541 stop:2410 length:870 start_codon:yes stop_codon:yes gene_type:complete